MLHNWKISFLDGPPQYVRAYAPVLEGEFFAFYSGDTATGCLAKAVRSSLIAQIDLYDGPIPKV